jgi:biopolymer transport protein ExbD
VAGSSAYKDDSDDEAITDINVTPFVDVVLVLLVVFMVTAKLIVGRGVEIEKPKAASGGDVQSTLRIAVKADGTLFVNGDEYKEDAAALARIKEIAATSSRPKAIIAGDRKTAYGGVMRAIDLATQAGVPIALENERPQ